MSKWRDAINLDDYLGEEGNPSDVDLVGLLRANVRMLFALIGGLVTFTFGTIPRTATRSLEALRSFGVEVVSVTVAVPRHILSGSFDAAIAEITTHGAVGMVSAVALFVIAFMVYSIGVRLIAS